MGTSIEALQVRLAAFPRLKLAEFPTPLEFMPRLSKELNREIYIKRDDGIGPGLGGNKTRKLEYFLADALSKNHRKVVTFGGLQSNHARITAAAARQVGLEPHLFFFEHRPARLEGNLLIDRLVGAHMHFIPFGGSGEASITLEQTIMLVRMVAWLRLGPHYFIPVGGHSWLGCLGYVQAALEVDQQSRAMGIQDAYLVVAAGTGGTLAGLMAGLALIDSPLRLLGIDVGRLWKAFPTSIAHSAAELCNRLDARRVFSPAQVPIHESTYVGRRYGKHTPGCMAALQRLARLEGILLDPIYTAKAFAGLLDLIDKGTLGEDGPIIFLHTGGMPGLFGFCDQLLEIC